jgi:hypothetical protein
MAGIPGMNLLDMALTLIAHQSITYYEFAGRTQNSVGQDVTTYDLPKTIVGSFQPIPRNLYQQYGLDFQKDYYTFYTSNDVIDVGRDVSGDQIAFNGERFQCESDVAWFQMDGWVGVICVHIGPDIADPVIWGFNSGSFGNRVNTYLNFGNSNFLRPEL